MKENMVARLSVEAKFRVMAQEIHNGGPIKFYDNKSALSRKSWIVA